jgi:surface polysaccharide O-acyltransferase-like enzyme
MIIAGIFNPKDYSNFVNFAAVTFLPLGFGFNIHGFFVGLLCFLIGFLFVSSGEIFWNSVRSIKFITLAFAIALFMQRLFLYLLPVWGGSPGAYPLVISNVLTAFESVCWMLSLVGFASSFLNKKNPILDYITPAVFPVYIFHLPVQNFLASFIYPLSIAPIVKLIILTFSTILVSVFLYEVVRRLKWFRVVFGMRP